MARRTPPQSASRGKDALVEELHAALVTDDPQRAALLDAILKVVVDHGLGPESPPVEIMQLLGDKWSSLILTLLGTGPFRPSELRRVVNLISRLGNSTPISQRVLTVKLRSYERLGFIQRTAWPTMPPRTDYRLTPLGRDLVNTIAGIVDWSLSHKDEITAAIHAYDHAGAD
ncbi:Transcriptional regulator, HxlR family [Sphingomonas paucimobilis]|uniref:winged helix-turn-helix transcriptional regulator n=1 Tax=Sphingobium sp. DC-2 TaxID=1303256 RepID=UPI00044E825A|nr:helix-turn-helix domain-containing protein [Sphingobium sp. DC-2]EZP71129.1 Transcriptional regulator, HxlR family [Sphingomonas paucimobilis]